ncbi:MAG: CBS domain-containing protein [Cyclobacteriaceae bacterium]|nr:CBS domain-containing protein [Cyclobacteriaceae bacterium]MDH4297983.1 CBS domain-containing protein [Cyclobacteriaceae bacterium]MDH5249454.1 CBS domain-containing protein [Cyclobacteriaceae bacterium]
MGEHNVNSVITTETRTAFISHLLHDIAALETMVEKDLFEKDVLRIGSEQEFCIVTDQWRPSKMAEQILHKLHDPHFTTELAQYNLEINLDPVELKTKCFSLMEKQLNTYLTRAKEVAEESNAKILLTGILPTITKNELTFGFMTPSPRYWALNDIIKELRGTDFELHLQGTDELTIVHDSVLFQACNTSFQLHLQIVPQDFISSYNWAQVISGPVLGISTNSPLLLGRELWSETRIALFQQSIDTRSFSYALQDQKPRVTFGNEWATGSVVDIFRNDIAQYKVILVREIHENSIDALKKGRLPKLEALRLHNSTVYHWNRPCYGVGNGKAHLRIENRYIPAGPSVADEMANFAFWIGLMKGRPSAFDDMANNMDFRDAKANFVKAARTGKDSILHWMGDTISVKELVLKELLPIAYSGLEKVGVDKEDRERLLGIIEKRTLGQTGSEWITSNYRQLRKTMHQDDALRALTREIYQYQQIGTPVHDWKLMKADLQLHESARLVGHIMSTQLFTVNENDLATLATHVMEWKNIHHVPVENNAGKFSGLLTWTHLQHLQNEQGRNDDRTVAEIMKKNVLTVRPETGIMEAISLMKLNKIGCLPVIQDQQLVGIVTIKDLVYYDHDESTQQGA